MILRTKAQTTTPSAKTVPIWFDSRDIVEVTPSGVYVHGYRICKASVAKGHTYFIPGATAESIQAAASHASQEV